jgi:thiamine-phosphate pyrophosphorylase
MRRFRRLKGLYLVVSPILSHEELLSATEKALKGGVDILQLSAEPEIFWVKTFASELADLAREHETPFLINNDLQLAKEVKADGVHFDTYEITPKEARQVLGKECLVGYTVNVDTQKVLWADKKGADYISFCSVFQECTATHCPVIPIETIRNARSLTSLSVFAAGGINLENAHLVLEAGTDGIAVTSGLLKAKGPEQTARAFKEIILKHQVSRNNQ